MGKKRKLIKHVMQIYEADPLSDDHSGDPGTYDSDSSSNNASESDIMKAEDKQTGTNVKRAKTSTATHTGQASTSSDHTTASTSQSSSSNTSNAKKVKLNENKITIEVIQQEEKYFKLVEKGDVNKFKKMKQVNLIQDRDNDKNTYLHRCILKCHNATSFSQLKDMIKYLITKEPELCTIKNKNEETPLCMACKKVLHNEVILLLVNTNCDMLHVTDKDGATPLHYVAVSLGWKTIYELFDPMDEDYEEPKRDDVNETALKLAEAFIQLGADVNVEDEKGRNILQYTIEQEGCYFYCKTSKQKENFHTYVYNMLELLKKYCASLVSTSGKHAIDYIRTVKEAEWVLDNDPEILNKDPGPGKYSITYNLMYNVGGTTEGDKIIDLYIRRGAIDRQNVDFISFARFKKCKFFVIESLLKRYPKYNVNALNLDGETMMTQYGKNVKTLDILLARGAKMNTLDLAGTSVLYTAAKKGSVTAIKKILDSGVDPGVFEYTQGCVLVPICHEFTKKRCRLQSYLELLSRILNYPSIKTSPMSEPLEQVFGYIFGELFNSLNWPQTKDRMIDVLTCIFNSNENIKSIIFKRNTTERHYTIAGYTFDRELYDLMGYAIQSYTSRSDLKLELSLETLVNMLYDLGISESNTPTGCISALTSALMGSEADYIRAPLPDEQQYRRFTRNSAVKEEIDRIINKLIQHGVKTNIQVLKIEDVKSNIFSKIQVDMILELIKTTHLSDALLLAFLRNKLELAKKLISEWCGPPLALMIFNPNIHHAEFIPWFEMLQSYGRIPHGTPMFQLLKHILEKLKSNAGWNITELTRDRVYTAKYQTFEKFLEPVLSLQELAKYAVRQSVSYTASQPDTKLNAVLHDLVPPLLRSVVIY